MKPTATILIGDPLSGAEAQFLATLATDLREIEAVILANFQAGDQQIDFMVITSAYAALLELKNFPRPIFGERNGRWTYLNHAGRRVPYQGRNPWQQAAKQKFALSDEMRAFQAHDAAVPRPSGNGFFADFDAFVCIYPTIHVESHVTDGDHRVRVGSYPEVLESLRTRAKPSTWSLADWRRFAEAHLHLEPASLEQATDPRVYAAADRVETYRARLTTVVGSQLPPLIPGSQNSNYGEQLVKTLVEPSNYLLLGPTGSAKTFHLHHLAVTVAKGEVEVPILVEGKRYRGGDFWSLVRHGTAQLFRGDPRELLDAIRLAGLKPVLLIDALNECPRAHVADLIRGAQAFVLQFDSRLVATSQTLVELPADIEAATIELRLPDTQQKRLIYGHHAGLPATDDLDSFCAGFTNAYDLTLAGLCHNLGSVVGSRAELYDRYVRRCVTEHQAVALALLRVVAWKMAEDFSMVWSRDLFETTAERILAEQRASLDVLDELRRSRLIDLTDDHFSFEHELLLDYFRAEELRRTETDVSALAAELTRPRNRDLLELMLPRFSDPQDVELVLGATRETSLLDLALSGRCGRAAQNVVLAQCDRLLKAAAEDLPTIEVSCVIADVDGGRKRYEGLRLKTKRAWTPYDALLCRVIADNLDIPTVRWGFLELLDATEWTLRTAVHKAARAARFDAGALWGEAVRLYGGVIQHGNLALPCVEILSGIRRRSMQYLADRPPLPIRSHLLERARRNPTSHVSLLTLLEHHEYASSAEDIAITLELVERALNSRIYILRVNAVDHLQSLRGVIEEVCPQELGRIRQMLDFETDNIMENTTRLEAVVAYGGLSAPIVSLQDALAEFRSLLSRTPENDAALAEMARLSGMAPEAALAEHAYGALTKIFEDIFENVYWEAYAELSNAEKESILCLAGMAPDVGFWSDWILRELFRYAGERALPIYERFASGINGETVLVQDAAASFVLGIHGCAQWTEAPPPYRKGASPEHRAWQLLGECLFWMAKGDRERAAQILNQLGGSPQEPVARGMGDALYQVSESRLRLREEPPSFDLTAMFAPQLRPIVEECLRQRESLPSIFRYGGRADRRVIAFLIATLGRIGDETTTATLRTLVDDPDLGTEAIHALEAIERRTRLGDRTLP